MILIACVDTKMGLTFNKRRQSRDREVCKRILDLAKDGILWIHPSTATLFGELVDITKQYHINIAEHPANHAGKGEFFFLDSYTDIGALYVDLRHQNIEQVILFRWNRDYPADTFLPVDVNKGWTQTYTSEFPGKSHEKITEDHYEKA